MDVETIRRVAIAAAQNGAAVLRSRLGNLTDVQKKSAKDLVTEADRVSEKRILDTIRAAFPDHGILAEESGHSGRNKARQWIIDPLDGTTNFANGLEIFSVSIAFAADGQVRVGVVLDPMRDELFSAVSGGGAVLNNRPLAVSTTDRVVEALLVTGFPYHLVDNYDAIMERFANCLKAARGVRRLGSAALDLCYVADGRFDGFWEEHLKPWDTAAGLLIAREAGARVTDFENRDYTPGDGQLLATNARIHDNMLSLMSLKGSS